MQAVAGTETSHLPRRSPTISPSPKSAIPALLGLFTACLLLSAGTAGAAIKIAAAGDISCPAKSTAQNAIDPNDMPHPAAAKCQGSQVAKLITAENPRMTFALGDLIQGQTSYKVAYNDFDLAWGSLGDRLVSTAGNHDYHYNANGRLTASGYFRYWESQNVDPWRYGKPDKGWSSWDLGSWHMINLNSNCNAVDCSFTGPQLRWLMNDLKQDRKNPRTQCIMAYMHHPLFSVGVKSGRTGDHTLLDNIWELLYRFRTDLVITGHQHYYERYRALDPGGEPDPTGITQIITGTGGASTFNPDGENDMGAPNAVKSIRSLGATFLDLEDDGYSSYFKQLLDGRVRDATEAAQCHKPNEGFERRQPRAKRYATHMKLMGIYARRIDLEVKRLRKLRRIDARPARVNRVERRLDSVRAKREKLRLSDLY